MDPWTDLEDIGRSVRRRSSGRGALKGITIFLPLGVFLVLLAGFLFERVDTLGDEFPEVLSPKETNLADVRLGLGTRVLNGRVLVDGAGVAGAAVYVRDGNRPLWAHTAEDGKFQISGLSEAALKLDVMRWGFDPESFEVAAGVNDIRIELTKRMEPAPQLPVVLRAPLVGELLAPLDASLEGYEVSLRPARPADQLGPEIARRTVADAEGKFLFEDLAAGDYALEVRPPWAAGGSWPELVAPRTRFLHHSAAGGELSFELSFGALEGTVVDDRANPIGGALVVLERRRDANGAPVPPGRLWPAATTATDGSFRFDDLPPGTYTLDLRAGDGIRTGVPAEVVHGQVAEASLPPLEPRATEPEAQDLDIEPSGDSLPAGDG